MGPRDFKDVKWDDILTQSPADLIGLLPNIQGYGTFQSDQQRLHRYLLLHISFLACRTRDSMGTCHTLKIRLQNSMTTTNPKLSKSNPKVNLCAERQKAF